MCLSNRFVYRATLICLTIFTLTIYAQPPGEGPALGPYRITQAEVENILTLFEIRREGQRIFSTPFNKLDGFGEVFDPANPTDPGGRPTLGDNGTHLRANGLDAQSCLECHSVVSSAKIPAKFGVGGVGGSSANVMAQPTEIDIDDELGLGYAFFNGRFINPPFVFGSGGVELLGKEMTLELQKLKDHAFNNPGLEVPLITKGVDFGILVYSHGTFDTRRVEGIDEDLVVRPFGRKGEFISTREFDQGAMRFHFGIEPVEVVGQGVDNDGDQIVDELTIGEMSVLAIFNTNLERPFQAPSPGSVNNGLDVFRKIGCADCHVPTLNTYKRELTYSFPEIPEDPTANVFYAVDLTTSPAGFRPIHNGGMAVPLFSDLKRHDMGPGLAENTGGELDRFFITARLWGIADTAPYLHDGRALTLTDAILAHGGEAQQARDNFDHLSDNHKVALLSFLRTLRTPTNPAADLQ